MAGITNDPGGNKRISFTGICGNRKHIRLGKMSRRDAESIARRVENIISAQLQGVAPDRAEARWLNQISSVLHKKLVRAGLCKPREIDNSPVLSVWVMKYIQGRVDIKPSTVKNMLQAANDVSDYFGSSSLLKDFTPLDGMNFRKQLLDRGLAEATVRRRCKRVKQFFAEAIKSKIISENPFDDVPTANRTSKERQQYISKDVIGAVIEACPNSQWRLIFALSRYAGLRIPSELLGLTWDNVLWDKGRFIVHSPKTEHIEGRAFRTVPIFPELLPYLQEAYELAPEGENRIITMIDVSRTNLRTQAHRIIKKAGIVPWPKTFHNLRSSCETDLAEEFPIPRSNRMDWQ